MHYVVVDFWIRIGLRCSLQHVFQLIYFGHCMVIFFLSILILAQQHKH